jgi:hypothetical protein
MRLFCILENDNRRSFQDENAISEVVSSRATQNVSKTGRAFDNRLPSVFQKKQLK